METIQKTGKSTSQQDEDRQNLRDDLASWRHFGDHGLPPQSEYDSVARETLFVTSVMVASTMNTMYANDAAMP